MTDAHGPVLHTVVDHPDMYLFWCPGCKCAHFVDERWKIQGSLERPTVTGSVLVKKVDGTKIPRCHLFVRDGKIQYLADCDHELAGKTVEMEPL